MLYDEMKNFNYSDLFVYSIVHNHSLPITMHLLLVRTS
jgi:hypothetical protein